MQLPLLMGQMLVWQKRTGLLKLRGVEITTVHADLAGYDIGIQQWM